MHPLTNWRRRAHDVPDPPPMSRKTGAGPDAQIGAVSFLHRFGSSLNAHFHFHVCVIDGAFCEFPEGSAHFHEAIHLTGCDWDELQHTVRHRVLRYFHRQGLLERHVTDDMLTWQASGGFSVDATVRIPAWDRAGLEGVGDWRSTKNVPESVAPRASARAFLGGSRFQELPRPVGPTGA